MKNQYLGDIGDYGKYGLLRFLASKGIQIGVNWYLTKNDNSNDGRGTQRSYIFAIHPERLQTYWDMLREFVDTDWKQVFEIEPVWQSIDVFQTVYPTKHEKEKALEAMSNEEIDHLISTSNNTYGKIFYSSFKK